MMQEEEFSPGSMALGAWRWEYGAGSTALGVWRWEHGAGSMAIGVWRRNRIAMHETFLNILKHPPQENILASRRALEPEQVSTFSITGVELQRLHAGFKRRMRI